MYTIDMSVTVSRSSTVSYPSMCASAGFTASKRPFTVDRYTPSMTFSNRLRYCASLWRSASSDRLRSMAIAASAVRRLISSKSRRSGLRGCLKYRATVPSMRPSDARTGVDQQERSPASTAGARRCSQSASRVISATITCRCRKIAAAQEPLRGPISRRRFASR